MGLGNLSSQTARDQSPIGMRWASKAGSALPFGPPSAFISARSSCCPPVPCCGATAAATAVRCEWRRELDTPVTDCPYTIEAFPPVRTILAGSAPNLWSFLKRGILALKFASRTFSSRTFLLPAAIPTPRDLTYCWNLMPSLFHRFSSRLPSDVEFAAHTDFFLESSIPTSSMSSATLSMKPPSSFSMTLSGPVLSADKSSTKRVGATVGWAARARSTKRSMHSRISVVASPLPDGMPRNAMIITLKHLPTLSTLGSL